MVKEIKRKTKRLINPTNNKISFVEGVDDEDCDYLFPCAMFTICIPESDLDKVVARDYVYINYSEPCIACCPHATGETIGRYLIESPIITCRTLIEGLILNNFAPRCNHTFLEGFIKLKDGSVDLLMGS